MDRVKLVPGTGRGSVGVDGVSPGQQAGCQGSCLDGAPDCVILGRLLYCNQKDAGNQSYIYTGRTDAETEVPILWPLM